MGKISIDAQVRAQVKNLAAGGDKMAICIDKLLDGIRVINLTAGAEGGGGAAANSIRISGQVQEIDGTPVKAVTDVYITSVPIAGVGTMTIGATGTIKKGSGTVTVWLQTNSSGAFEIDVLNAAAEDNLVRFELDNGEVEIVKLTFA